MHINKESNKGINITNLSYCLSATIPPVKTKRIQVYIPVPYIIPIIGIPFMVSAAFCSPFRSVANIVF